MGEIETARKEDFDAIAALNVQAYAEFAPHLHSGAWDVMQAAQHVYRSLGFVQDIELPPRHGIRYFRFVLKLAS